jgi:TolB-like protein/tetratricopeptide (TPR) repeat protein
MKRWMSSAARPDWLVKYMTRIEFLLSELRRRRVFRVLVGYLALSFALIQGADLVYPVLGFDSWAFSATVAVMAIGLVPALIFAWIYDITREGVRRTPSVLMPEPTSDGSVSRAHRDPPPRSIAVLPFANYAAGTENDYFSDGVTEDIIGRLCRIPGLKVISRTSVMQYKGSQAGLARIAAELCVAHILEGSVRRAGGRVRIAAQLVDARSDELRWAETFDRDMDDIFTIQSDVSSRIADELATRLSSEERSRLRERPTQNLEAYDLYLRGRFAWNLRTGEALEESVRLLIRATELDPGFARAWATLAEAYVTLGIYGALAPDEAMPVAQSAAARALALDPTLPEALAARACVHALWDYDLAAAARAFQSLIRSHPQDGISFQWYALNVQVPRGEFEEASRILEAALELDPLSPIIQAGTGVLAYYSREFASAVACSDDVLRLHPQFGFAHYVAGLAHLAADDPDRAIDSLQLYLELSGASAEGRSALACAVAAAGDPTRARGLLAQLEAEARARWVSPVLLAQVQVALRENGRAVAELERAYTLRAPDLVWLGVRPTFDDLRSHPAFVDLLYRIGLPTVPAPGCISIH